jgi:Lanthionine-containing peptide SapB precursor RamS
MALLEMQGMETRDRWHGESTLSVALCESEASYTLC